MDLLGLIDNEAHLTAFKLFCHYSLRLFFHIVVCSVKVTPMYFRYLKTDIDITILVHVHLQCMVLLLTNATIDWSTTTGDYGVFEREQF